MQEMKKNSLDAEAANETSPVRKLFSVLLVVSGVLIMATAGVCTVLALASGMGVSKENLMLVALFGGIPLVVGVILFKWGKWLGSSKNVADIDPASSDPSQE